MILKNDDGSYRVRWREAGKLRQKTVHRYEAAERLNARKVLRQRGGQPGRRGPRHPPDQPRNITVAAFATDWLTRVRGRVAPKTYASYAETIRRYITKPGVGIGQLRVRDLQRGDIETMLQQAGATSRALGSSRATPCGSFARAARCYSMTR